MAIQFPEEQRRRIREALQTYCRDHFDQDPGVLQTDVLYDFVVALVGAAAYNQGVADAQAYMQTKLLDLEIDVHEIVEFGK